MEMNKERFLKFIVSEIERQQKDMYKTGEGKRIVENLTQIYTLVSDGKFDVHSNRGEEISEEIRRAHGRKFRDVGNMVCEFDINSLTNKDDYRDLSKKEA